MVKVIEIEEVVEKAKKETKSKKRTEKIKKVGAQMGRGASRVVTFLEIK